MDQRYSHADRRLCLGAFLGFALLVSGALSQQTIARQGSSSGSGAGITCDVAPRAAADVLALLAPPSAGNSPVQLAPPLPPREPADPVTTAEIAAVVQELEACLNAGDFLRFYALHSDDWFRNLPPSRELAAEISAQLATPPAPRAEGYREAFIGPWFIHNLDDGRVLAAVVWFGSEDDSRLDPSLTRIVYFVQQDGRWLIDDVVERVFVPECGHSVKAAVVVGPPPGAALDAPPMSCYEAAEHHALEISRKAAAAAAVSGTPDTE